MLFPPSQFFPPPSGIYHLWKPLVLKSVSLFLLYKCFCIIFIRLSHISDIIWYMSLTSLSMIIFGSIHVAANSIISFFLWLNTIPLCLCTTSFLSIPCLEIAKKQIRWQQHISCSSAGRFQGEQEIIAFWEEPGTGCLGSLRRLKTLSGLNAQRY